jgi:uncharacterized protein YraI
MKRLLLPLIALAALATPAVAADTARASGVLAVHTGHGEFFPIIDKLAKNERVRLDTCTRRSRWCHVIQLDGGPSGWVDGSYLVGSPAKNAVTPFEFSFDPLDPGNFNFRR